MHGKCSEASQVYEIGATCQATSMTPAATNGSSRHLTSTTQALPEPRGPPISFAPPLPISLPAAKPKAKRPRASSKGNDAPRGERPAKAPTLPKPTASKSEASEDPAAASPNGATGQPSLAEPDGAVPPKPTASKAAVAEAAPARKNPAMAPIAAADASIRLRGIVADSSTMQGRRPKQEDRHVKIPDLTKAAKALKMPIDHLEQPCSFFGVYDGHQGHACSDFVAKNFHMLLLKRLTAEKSAATWTEERVQGMLIDVCQELDGDFLSKYRTAPDGSTVVVAFVTGTRLFVAWAGDSRCLLCQSTSSGEISTIALTEDHRPSVASEADRVKKAGGVVVDLGGALRVAQSGYEEKVKEIRRAQAQGLGVIGKEPVALAVSRSLGDRHFKEVTGRNLLIATPEVRCLRLDKSHKFLTLMCDGIPDVMSNEDSIFALDYIQKPSTPQNEVKAACGNLVQEAYKRGSEDNLTALLARLQWVDVDPKAATNSTKIANTAKDASAKELPGPTKNGATHSKDIPTPASNGRKVAAAEAPLPGESVLDALKRKHRETVDDRAEAEGPLEKIRKTAADFMEAVEGSDAL